MSTYKGISIFADANGEVLNRYEIGLQANLQNGQDIRYGQRLFPILHDGFAPESAAMYGRVDPVSPEDLAHLITMEITSAQDGDDASATKVIHAGHGDAHYVALLDNGVAFESASFFSGSRGFISTTQQISGSPGDFGNSTLYTGLWGSDGSVYGSTTRPNFGMLFMDRSMGHSLRVRQQDTSVFAFAKFPEFRVSEWDLSRDRWIAYNDGSTTMSSTAATLSAPNQPAPELEGIGSWWTGTVAEDKSWIQNMVIDGSGNPSWQLSVGDTGSETIGITVSQSGEVALGPNITVPNRVLTVHSSEAIMALFRNTLSGEAKIDIANQNIFWALGIDGAPDNFVINDRTAGTNPFLIEPAAPTGAMTINASGDTVLGSTSHLILPQVNDAATPTLAFGDGNTGFYEAADNVIGVSVTGAFQWQFRAGQFGAANTGRAAIFNEDPSDTNPNIVTRSSDTDTGIGSAAVDQLSLIAGAVEGIRVGTTAVTTLNGRVKNVTRITNVESPYTVLATDHHVFCDTDGGAITVNLPAGIAGTEYEFVNTGSSGNAVTIVPNGVELLSGANTSDVLVDGGRTGYVYETTEGWY